MVEQVVELSFTVHFGAGFNRNSKEGKLFRGPFFTCHPLEAWCHAELSPEVRTRPQSKHFCLESRHGPWSKLHRFIFNSVQGKILWNQGEVNDFYLDEIDISSINGCTGCWTIIHSTFELWSTTSIKIVSKNFVNYETVSSINTNWNYKLYVCSEMLSTHF